MNFSINEVSWDSCFTKNYSKEEMGKIFKDFLLLLRDLKKEKKLDSIVSVTNIFGVYLLENYSVIEWIEDIKPNKDLHMLALSLLKQIIVFDDYEGEFVFKDFDKCECKGALYVIENDDINGIISLITDEIWKKSILEGKYKRYNTNFSKLIENNERIKNYSSETNIAQIVLEEQENSFKELSSTRDLWEKRDKLFPNLIFCDSVKKQLYQKSDKYLVLSIAKRLKRMQEYFMEEHESYSPVELGYNARTESESVKNSSDLKRKRLFILPTGKEEYFFDHISFNAQYEGRIHFLPDVQNKRCYIGYIGEHLDTATYKF